MNNSKQHAKISTQQTGHAPAHQTGQASKQPAASEWAASTQARKQGVRKRASREQGAGHRRTRSSNWARTSFQRGVLRKGKCGGTQEARGRGEEEESERERAK